MNPVAMEPIGTMGGSEIGPPGGNAEAGISGEGRNPIRTYCIEAYEDGTYRVQIESSGAGMPDGAEGEEASLAPAPVEGEGDETGEQSLGEGLTAVEACKAFIAAEKARLSGGESQEQDTMDQGFAGQGGGAVHG